LSAALGSICAVLEYFSRGGWPEVGRRIEILVDTWILHVDTHAGRRLLTEELTGTAIAIELPQRWPAISAKQQRMS
jgi:hypothetical protein